MKTRIIYTKIWKDEFYAGLNRAEKILFIYLITNERVNLCGMYELSDREIMFDTQLTTDELLKAKQSLSSRFLFKKGWVRIYNFERYNNYSGDKNRVAIQNELKNIPDEIKEYPIDTLLGDEDTVSTFGDTPNNHKSETINHKLELITEEEKENLIDILVEKGIDRQLVVSEIAKFINYWTEKNMIGTKERWQLEKTFEVQKRLTTWFNNINKFGGDYGKKSRTIIG
jgi:hypothetical protein